MSLSDRAKGFVKKALERKGYALVKKSVRPNPERLIRQIKRCGLEPATVIDVGVAEGTPWLYRGFGQAKFHLIDPTRDSLPYMEDWAKKIDASVHNIAAGNCSRSVEIKIRDTILHATVFSDVTQPNLTDTYIVKMERLDHYLGDFAEPALCKIDVEGAELLVLEGMEGILKKFSAIVVETSINSLYREGVDFDSVVSFMKRFEFCFYDFVGMVRRPYDEALHQIDAVFIPKDSPLREKRWD